MSVSNETGTTMDRYADLLETLVALAIAWKGSSVSTDEKELLGHLIRNIALLLGEINEIIQDVYDSSSVSNATGVRLDGLMELIGITRQSNTKSTAVLTLTVSKATTIPAGSLAKTDAGVQFETDTDLVFAAAGSDDVASTCTEYGDYDAAIGEIDTIVTSVNGWTTVTNAAAAVPGRYRELDGPLKERHTIAVSTSGDRDAASIYEAVYDVAGVSAAAVLEDYTSDTPVSVYVIGGLDADIAAAIDGQLTVGIGTNGTTAVDVYDTTLAQNKTINFTRATDQDIYVDMTLTINDTLFPADGEIQIRDALVALIGGTDTDSESVVGDQRIGDDVQYLKLPGPILSVQGVVISELYLGAAASPTSTTDLHINADKRARLDAVNVTIGYTS